MLTAAALAFLLNVAGGVFNWIFKKAGRLTTQVVLFVIALAVAMYWQYGTESPTLVNAVQIAIVLFSMSVGIYEVLLRYFPLFSGPQDQQG